MSISQFIKNLRDSGLEFFGLYYGTYRGVVTNNKDPLDLGRIRVAVTGLGFDKEDEIDAWAYPDTPYGGKDYGIFFPPDEGDEVCVRFERGDLHNPVYVGGWWKEPKQSEKDTPEVFQTDGKGPIARGIQTPSGHKVILSKEGFIEVETADGNFAKFDDESSEVVLEHSESKTTITLKEDKVKVETLNAEVIAEDQAKIDSPVVVTTEETKLGDGSIPVARKGDKVVTSKSTGEIVEGSQKTSSI